MQAHCAHCGDSIPESMGSVKAGDLDEHWRGLREARKIRALCGNCATFYANVRPCLRWLICFAWLKHPVPMWKIFKTLGIRALAPVE